jgi:small subunit ribosomal protein S6
MVSKEDWGLKNGYEIQNKKVVLSFIRIQSTRRVLIAFETEFRRDERVMRFLTVSLDTLFLGLKEEEQN